MELTAVIFVLLAIFVAAVTVWVLRKAGFKVGEIKIKVLSVIELILKRDAAPGTPEAHPTAPHPHKQEVSDTSNVKAAQEASKGGVIEKSSIKAPAAAGGRADLRQEAGNGGKIVNSHIELK